MRCATHPISCSLLSLTQSVHDPSLRGMCAMRRRVGHVFVMPIHAFMVQEAMRLRDAFKEMTGGCQGAFTVEGIIDV